MSRPSFSLELAVPCLLSVVLSLSGCDFLGLGKSQTESKRPVTREQTENKPAELSYVGRAACSACHQEVMESYNWSKHDRALDVPSKEAVSAPFEGEKLAGKHVAGIFARADGKPVIQSVKDRPVKWTIGAEPLQQYLVEAEGGRVQAFPIAYDTRENGAGGKRWYMLNEGDVPTGDLLHWEGDAFNWNFMCADCHSTNLKKNYNLEKNTYDTAFSELDVSCEACHGPGSLHVKLANENKEAAEWPSNIKNAGFELQLATYALRRWVRTPEAKVATLFGNGDAPPERTDELTSCAPCHSRRSDLGRGTTDVLVSAYNDRYRLSLIEPDLYFADGQIKDEVYEYGSFLQSKMYAAGVVCSDCHNPHSTTLRKPVVDLCVTCHDPGTYEEETHHMHPATAEVTCVDCHMPERVYMGVDARRDHRLSVPRPDLTLTLGVPNACENCHANRPKWAATMIAERFGATRPDSFANAFHAAEQRHVDAPTSLAALLDKAGAPGIVRASALTRWAALGRSTPEFNSAVAKAADDSEMLVRRAAAEASVNLAPEEQAKILEKLAADKVRSVRVEAALAAVNMPLLPGGDSKVVRKALEEARAAQTENADRAVGLLGLAALEHRLGNSKRALELYKLASERHPNDPVIFVNWADLLRALKREEEAQAVLVAGLAVHKDEPSLLHARALWLVRQKRIPEALPLLQTSFEKAPGTLRRRYGYVYAVAIQNQGDWAEAMAILRVLKKEYPEASEVDEAMVVFEEQRKAKR